MGDITKSKLIVSEEFYNKLIDDKDLFNIESSENEFFLNILVNTDLYNERIKKNDKIKNILLDPNDYFVGNSIVNAIKKKENDKNFNKEINDISIMLSNALYMNEYSKGLRQKTIHIRESKSHPFALRKIINKAMYVNTTDLLKSILFDYSNYPLYTREMILFINTYEELMKCKKEKLVCSIETKNNKKFDFKVVDIKPGHDEFHYYVIGLYDFNNKLASIKLSSITLASRTSKFFDINDEQSLMIAEAIKKGPEWIGATKINHYIIKFDDEGLKRYKQFYKDRPKGIIDQNDPMLMHFDCSETQLWYYLRLFGKHAVVQNNIILAKALRTAYKDGFEAYDEIVNKSQ